MSPVRNRKDFQILAGSPFYEFDDIPLSRSFEVIEKFYRDSKLCYPGNPLALVLPPFPVCPSAVLNIGLDLPVGSSFLVSFPITDSLHYSLPNFFLCPPTRLSDILQPSALSRANPHCISTLSADPAI
jgi:hypothetical protein